MTAGDKAEKIAGADEADEADDEDDDNDACSSVRTRSPTLFQRCISLMTMGLLKSTSWKPVTLAPPCMKRSRQCVPAELQ
ncbi:hypothetical protein EYF80_027784 [Liparis tanakae]|uniref:Uncharacterized protein n=1 Tax=Liparis tanakae TaxID=230148 RepID=A0A4Z2H810_9TELE|nr:hypothetical protein EYF80_027784 [Liparis tanakae]